LLRLLTGPVCKHSQAPPTDPPTHAAAAQVFSKGQTRAHEEMRQACFDYLALGGTYSSGPVSLLSGLNPRPSVLVMHFFMVALFGVGRCAWVAAGLVRRRVACDSLVGQAGGRLVLGAWAVAQGRARCIVGCVVPQMLSAGQSLHLQAGPAGL
jgi:hypothetical protein